MKTPEFKGYELEFVNVAEAGVLPTHDPETCTHPDGRLVTYAEDGDRFCACRDCGAIWEMHSEPV